MGALLLRSEGDASLRAPHRSPRRGHPDESTAASSRSASAVCCSQYERAAGQAATAMVSQRKALTRQPSFGRAARVRLFPQGEKRKHVSAEGAADFMAARCVGRASLDGRDRAAVIRDAKSMR
jgi:hypothetical protein